jgi:short-subunit dehydrogenase
MTRRPTALVTGASGGIGEAVARELAGRGHDLVLVARRERELQDLAQHLAAAHGVAAEVIPFDLAQPMAGAELAHVQRGRRIDVLVNSAGFADFKEFTAADLAKLRSMINVNVGALTELTHELLPGMIEQGSGRVLNVASTAAFMPGPVMAVYYATKAYVLSLSEAVAREVHGTGVTVTALCPGPTRTGFQARAAMESSKLVKGRSLMDAGTVARLGVDGLLAGRPVVVPGWNNKLQAVFPRFTPRRLVPVLVERAQSDPATGG